MSDHRRAGEWPVRRGREPEGCLLPEARVVPKATDISEQIAYCIACAMQGSPQKREFLQSPDLTVGSIG